MATLAAALVLPPSAATAAAPPALVVTGTCREGAAHGAYELKTASGRVRAAGAFNRGKRTGSFIYWNSAGVRVAHVPYDDDRLSGTLALWYPGPLRNGSAPQKLEAVFAQGQRNGTTRSWYADGRPRGEYRYEGGRLEAALAWNAKGGPLPEAEARAQAARDAQADGEVLAGYEALVRANLPACEVPAPSLERP